MLEILFTNTNDDFHYKLSERFQKSLELNLYFLKNSDFYKDVKFTVVDWGSKKNFSNCINFEKKYANKINFINVPHKITKKFSKETLNNYYGSLAANIGFRRSKSKFIMHLAHDQFLPTFCWNNLLSFLKNSFKKKLFKTVIYFPRYLIRKEFLIKNPDFQDVNNYILNSNFNFEQGSKFKFNTGAGCSFVATSKLIKKVKGYYEKPDFACDFDIHLKFSNEKSRFIDGRNIGVYSLKFPTLNLSRRNEIIKNNRSFYIKDDYYKNNKTWGLPDYNFKIIKNKKSKKINKQNFNFLINKNELDNESFLEFLKLAHVDNLFQSRNLALVIIYYYIFNYTKNLNLISFSKNNLNSVMSIQNCFKILNVYYCSKEKYLNSNFFSNSFFRKLNLQTHKSIGKFEIIKLENINKVFNDKKNFSFAIFVDDLNFKDIEKYVKFISFIIFKKNTNLNNSKLKSFDEFINFEEYGVLINKSYKKYLFNKKLILQKTKKRLSNIFLYRIYFIYLNFFEFFKKTILKNIKRL